VPSEQSSFLNRKSAVCPDFLSRLSPTFYTVTYYPAPNPNEGFRKISVEIVSDPGKKYRVQGRPGYRPSRSF
jgi:hypothetical protein